MALFYDDKHPAITAVEGITWQMNDADFCWSGDRSHSWGWRRKNISSSGCGHGSKQAASSVSGLHLSSFLGDGVEWGWNGVHGTKPSASFVGLRAHCFRCNLQWHIVSEEDSLEAFPESAMRHMLTSDVTFYCPSISFSLDLIADISVKIYTHLWFFPLPYLILHFVYGMIRKAYRLNLDQLIRHHLSLPSVSMTSNLKPISLRLGLVGRHDI